MIGVTKSRQPDNPLQIPQSQYPSSGCIISLACFFKTVDFGKCSPLRISKLSLSFSCVSRNSLIGIYLPIQFSTSRNPIDPNKQQASPFLCLFFCLRLIRSFFHHRWPSSSCLLTQRVSACQSLPSIARQQVSQPIKQHVPLKLHLVLLLQFLNKSSILYPLLLQIKSHQMILPHYPKASISEPTRQLPRMACRWFRPGFWYAMAAPQSNLLTCV